MTNRIYGSLKFWWNFFYCNSLSAACEAANPQFALHSAHIFLLQVVERKRTPAEIREEYERLQKEREERRLQQRTNPKVCSGEDNKTHTELAVTLRVIKHLVHIIYNNTEHSIYSWTCCLQGTISVGIDATDLFDQYEEDYEDMSGGGVPHVEINKMHISQSIEVMVALVVTWVCK